MKKWNLVWTLFVLVIALSGISLFFYIEQGHTLDKALQRISTLEENGEEIQQQLDESLSHTSGLNNQLNTIEANLSQLESGLEELQSIRGDISQFRDQLGELSDGILEINQKLVEINPDYFSAAQIIEAAEPFVVYIEASYLSYQVSGSGIIVSSSGHVITNYHVVEGMKNLNAILNTGETISLELLKYHADRDIAILKLVSDRTDFPFAPLGDSDTILVGSDVLAIGYPYPLGDIIPGRASVTRGIVSAMRKIDGYNYLQTDTAINPGNSGGALLNFAGELVGVNVAKYVDVNIEGIGLAIPINEVKNMINEHAG